MTRRLVAVTVKGDAGGHRECSDRFDGLRKGEMPGE